LNPVTKNILDGCKEQDRRCQQALYQHCFADMVKLCRWYSTDNDAAAALYNSGMLKVFTHIHQCKDNASLMPWIRRIMVNTAIDQHRQAIKETVYPVDIPETREIFISPEIEQKISAEECLQLIRELPVNAALVFNLFVMEGYKHEEISQLLQIPTGTSKWQLNEARRLLKKKLESVKHEKTYSNVI
jgi:RNA polymerase sigma-70 factor (ECF subfamily)